MVIDISDFFKAYTIYIIPAIIFAVVAIKQYVATPVGKKMYDLIFMNMPIFGGIVIKGNLSQFTRTLSTMIQAGIPLPDALTICIDTTDNSIIQGDMAKVRKAVVQGKTLTEPLLKITYFPDMVAQMIKVGEQTGNMELLLDKVSQVFEEEVNELVGGMTKMIEPLIIVVLGGAVAFVLVAMYMPIFTSAGGAG